MSADPFAAYRPKIENPIQEEEEDPFSAFRPKFQEGEPESEPKEGLLGGALRQGGRTLARVSETAIGAPRAFGEFLEGLVPEKALIKGAEKVGLGKGAETLIGTTKKYAPYKLFPKSEDVRDFNKFLFGKKVEPQNEWEEKADDLIRDFTALALPLPGSKLKLLKPAVLALGGNVASDVVGRMGGSEKEKTYTKLGTFLLGSLYNPGGAKKLSTELYEKARQNRAPNSTVSASNLKRKVSDFRTQLNKGGSAGSKNQSLKKLDEIENAIQHGQIEIEELEKFKQSVNEARSGLYEEFKGNKPGRKLAKANLDRVSKIIDDSLTEYGKINPQWEAYYRPANEVHGAIAQSNKVRNFIGRNIGKVSPHITAGLFGLGEGGVKTLTNLGTTVATGAAAVESSALLSRIYKSPTLRKYYSGVIQNAIKEDAIAMRENLRKLEKDLKKED